MQLRMFKHGHGAMTAYHLCWLHFHSGNLLHRNSTVHIKQDCLLQCCVQINLFARTQGSSERDRVNIVVFMSSYILQVLFFVSNFCQNDSVNPAIVLYNSDSDTVLILCVFILCTVWAQAKSDVNDGDNRWSPNDSSHGISKYTSLDPWHPSWYKGKFKRLPSVGKCLLVSRKGTFDDIMLAFYRYMSCSWIEDYNL